MSHSDDSSSSSDAEERVRSTSADVATPPVETASVNDLRTYSSSHSVFTAGDSRTHRPSREGVLQRLSEALLWRSLVKIDLSQRGLRPADSRLVKMALLQNAHLSVLKLGYNDLGDEGTKILAGGIAQHGALESIDLGFNNVGDEGCQALASAIATNGTTVHTLYLAGNLIGQDGALSIADLLRQGSSLRRLYLTGNKLGAEGVTAITDAIIEGEQLMADHVEKHGEGISQGAGMEESPARNHGNHHCSHEGMQELFLGGTDMGPGGCQAVARLLGRSADLRVLSLTNCDFGDESIAKLAASIKSNRARLPLESLQLSFNRMSCRGVDLLFNSLWGSESLKELRLDNNKIGDPGTQRIAGVLPTLKNLDKLDLGFNKIKTRGMMLLMKAIAESSTVKSLSVSGNSVDTNAAKAITYALAYSQTLVSLALVGCGIREEGRREIVAGLVSNRHTSLREFSGFDVGPVIVTLGFPAPLAHWNNEQVFNFIHLMWSKADTELLASEEEKAVDPLNFLDGDGTDRKATPLEASVVVEIAKKTFAILVEDGVDVFSRLPGSPRSPESLSPIAANNLVFESNSPDKMGKNQSASSLSSQFSHSFVAPPEDTSQPVVPDPLRKKRIVEWLCTHIEDLNKLSQLPFSSSSLARLHQHYFTPVVNESGGSVAPSPNPSVGSIGASASSSIPGVSVISSSATSTEARRSETHIVPPGGSAANVSPSGIASLPLMKRKVSYRCLGDAALASAPRLISSRRDRATHAGPVSALIEQGPVGHSLPRKTKRARRNRSRISFLPRVKAQLDSYLDVCHEKALITMRQLYFVERAILHGQVNPIDPAKTARTHLCGEFANDAETIIMDMI